MTGRTSTKVTDRAGTPGLGDRTCQDEDVAAQDPEARVLQNEVYKAKGPIELNDTGPKPEDRPDRRADAPEEGMKKTASAQEAHEGMSDALLSGEVKAESCDDLPVHEEIIHEKIELIDIDPPPRARARATKAGEGSVTSLTMSTGTLQ